LLEASRRQSTQGTRTLELQRQRETLAKVTTSMTRLRLRA
jgi:hypothetical protein